LRGLPEKTSLPTLPTNIIVYNHLPTDSFNQVMNESEFVIGRSGYSTIMDIVALGKKSILISTPGQPEQEYLAEYLFNKKIILRARQEDFVLEACLKEARQFSFVKYDRQDKELLETAISEMLHAINL
jgi:UDP-N-acetylglucosamine:LPS N-acetylglucosamine transferase